MRVVLDTNIFISGIFWENNSCSAIIDAWQAGKLTLVSSLEIVQELVDTLRDFRIIMPEEMIEAWRKTLMEHALLVAPAEKLALVKDDPDDDKFFEAAVAGHAQYLVSQDKQVLNIPTFRGIKTIHPKIFVKLLS